MRLSSLIGHAHELLTEILRRPAIPADGVISRFYRDRRYLGGRDRGFITETVYGALRDVIRNRVLFQPELRNAGLERESALLLAASLFQHDAAIDIAEVASGVGLAHGQLRGILEVLGEAVAQIEALPEPSRTAVRHSMPLWLVERLGEQMEHEELDALLAALNQQAPITLRANRLRTTPEGLAEALAADGIPTTPGRYSVDALHLQKRINANAVKEFKEGWFELQDEGSQLLSLLLDPHPNWRVFDACAGAGGKALHLSAIMKGRGAIVAHDVNVRRLEEIRPRMKRSGAQNIRVMEPNDFRAEREKLAGSFDAVLIDAPCTGAGVLRRNPGARLTLDEAMLERVTSLQADILDNYSDLVKPGGLLFYATCSLLKEENEEQVNRFLTTHAEFSLHELHPPQGMLTSEGYFRCYPHRHGTDGFFGAMLRRKPD